MQGSSKSAVVTGAGSGIGRAISLKLAREGWRVALVGRSGSSLSETASLMTVGRMRPEILTCDVASAAAVEAMAASVLSRFGGVQTLINAAGVNIPNRQFRTLSVPDFQRVVETNLYGAWHCTRAFLPGMLEAGEGTIVNISSEAGRQASVKSGAAYVASKFGLAGLTQSINVEERDNGIRACCFFLGDVATSLLDYRPDPPSEAARSTMLQAEDVADCVHFVLSLPARALMEEMILRPRLTKY